MFIVFRSPNHPDVFFCICIRLCICIFVSPTRTILKVMCVYRFLLPQPPRCLLHTYLSDAEEEYLSIFAGISNICLISMIFANQFAPIRIRYRWLISVLQWCHAIVSGFCHLAVVYVKDSVMIFIAILSMILMLFFEILFMLRGKNMLNIYWCEYDQGNNLKCGLVLC